MDGFIYIIGLLITIVAYLAALTYWLDKRFEGFKCRFQVVVRWIGKSRLGWKIE